MVKGNSFGREDGTAEQRSGYRLSCRLESLIEHRVAEHRKFLAARTGASCGGLRLDPWGHGDGELYDDEALGEDR